METKSFSYELLDKKLYEFSERAREDIDYWYLQKLIRKEKIAEINSLFPGKENEAFRDGVCLREIHQIYTDREIAGYIEEHPIEMKRLIYHSFKIKNEIIFEKFLELIDDNLAKKLLSMLNELETIVEGLPDEDVCKELGLNKNQLVRINKTQPHVYQWLKTNVKKKTEKE